MSIEAALKIPEVLELLRVATPTNPHYVLGDYHLEVCSVEFWTGFSGIRLVWPLSPSGGLESIWPTAVAVGTETYGCGQWRVGGIGAMTDMYVSTDTPLPLHTTDLVLHFRSGSLPISLCPEPGETR